jgi:hypothetical protein
MFVCDACGAIGKPVTESFLADIGAIYGAYDVYYQGGGMEQLVYDSISGAPLRRSELLSRRLGASGLLPDACRMMDLGCGNGSFMRSLSAHMPGWSFNGLELDRRHEAELKTIPRFAKLELGDVKSLEGRYDLISMIHALEHFLDPFETLVSLRRNLTADGLVFIEIPNVQANPFDLLIADHVSHFTPWSLEAILLRAGYEICLLETDWVKKELSVLARPVGARAAAAQDRHPADLARRQIAWLDATLGGARAAASGQGAFGLFGTSIAATWLTGALEGRVDFYLDEDESRIGKSFFDRPVLAPEKAPSGAIVYVGLAPVIAGVIASKISRPGLTILAPPALEAA